MGKSSKSLRVTIAQDGKARCLLSVAENASGDLIINLYGKQRDGTIPRPFNTTAEDEGERIIESRYTVHVSPDSTMGVNTINLHRTLESGPLERLVFHTTAIKKSNNFAPLYGKLCSSMRDPGYDVKGGTGRVESLGKVTTKFSLMFAILVGPPHRKFKARIPFANVKTLKFKQFSMVIVWSFLTMPSNNHSKVMHVIPLGDELYGGIEAREFIEVFDYFRADLRKEMIEVISHEPELADWLSFYQASTYLSKAEFDSDEFRIWSHAVGLAGMGP